MAQNKKYICYRLLTLIAEGGENLANKKPNFSYVKGKYGTQQNVTAASMTPKMKARDKYLDDLHEAKLIEREENPDAHVNHNTKAEQMKNH